MANKPAPKKKDTGSKPFPMMNKMRPKPNKMNDIGDRSKQVQSFLKKYSAGAQ